MTQILKPVFATFLLVTSAYGAAADDRVSRTEGGLQVGWGDIGRLFRERYAERAPNRNAKLAAAYREVTGGAFRFDPLLSVSDERYGSNASQTTDVKSYKLSQTSPWGSYLELHQTEAVLLDALDTSALNPGRRNGFTAKQDLLRGGLWNAFTPGRVMAAKRQLDELDATIDFDNAFHKAISALLAAQRSGLYKKAAETSLKRASDENIAVTSLVTAGYRAKADQLIAGASEVRARLRVESAARSLENAVRDLATALWQNPQDTRLTVSTDPAPTEVYARLQSLAWPEEPTTLQRERANLQVMTLNADLANRAALPELALQFTLDKYTPPASTQGRSLAPQTERSAQLSLTVPLVSSLTREEVKLARLDETAASAKFQETANALLAQKASLLAKVSLAEVSLKAAQQLLDFAKQTSALEMQKYRDGKSTINDMRRAQEDEDAGELAAIDGSFDLLQARLDYGLAAGRIGEALQ